MGLACSVQARNHITNPDRPISKLGSDLGALATVVTIGSVIQLLATSAYYIVVNDRALTRCSTHRNVTTQCAATATLVATPRCRCIVTFGALLVFVRGLLRRRIGHLNQSLFTTDQVFDLQAESRSLS